MVTIRTASFAVKKFCLPPISVLCVDLRSYKDYFRYKKFNVKRFRYRPGVAYMVVRGIALLFHDRGSRRWVSGQ